MAKTQAIRSKSTSGGRQALKNRTREVLSREIGFIPNPQFKELDNDRSLARKFADEALSGEEWVLPSNRSAFPAHLERMCSAPLLSPIEERDFFCKMNYLKYRANALRSTLNEKRPSVRQLKEIDKLLSGASQLRNRIVRSNVRLVVSIVKKFSDEFNTFDDLLSDGISCLLYAVEKFDFDRGFRFSTYATMAVQRDIFRRIKSSHRDRTRFATGATDILDQQLDAETPTERTESALMRIDRDISRMLTRLDDRERFIVRARFGFIEAGVKPSFAKLGKQLGVSKERVRQLELRAMNKLRDLVDEFGLLEGGLV